MRFSIRRRSDSRWRKPSILDGSFNPAHRTFRGRLKVHQLVRLQLGELVFVGSDQHFAKGLVKAVAIDTDNRNFRQTNAPRTRHFPQFVPRAAKKEKPEQHT